MYFNDMFHQRVSNHCGEKVHGVLFEVILETWTVLDSKIDRDDGKNRKIGSRWNVAREMLSGVSLSVLCSDLGQFNSVRSFIQLKR